MSSIFAAVNPEWSISPERGEMETRISALDCSNTAIGPPEQWSQALRTTVRILLANRFPMLLWWGPDYISIYRCLHPGTRAEASMGFG